VCPGLLGVQRRRLAGTRGEQRKAQAAGNSGARRTTVAPASTQVTSRVWRMRGSVAWGAGGGTYRARRIGAERGDGPLACSPGGFGGDRGRRGTSAPRPLWLPPKLRNHTISTARSNGSCHPVRFDKVQGNLKLDFSGVVDGSRDLALS
jgi:hypothetical protein